MRRFALLVASLAWLTGCGVGNRMLASRQDYALYRETRVAPSAEARLTAAGRYLREEPEGRFRPEVRAWFEAFEARFFAEAHDRPSLLRAYLRALPHGPHADAAAARLVEFGLLNAYHDRREAASEQFILRAESELDHAEAARSDLLKVWSELFALLANVRSFGQPTSALDDQLIYRFRLEPPAGHCEVGTCSKPFTRPYWLPTKSGFVAREADFTLDFQLEAGGVERVSVSGFELFSRLTEVLDRVVLDPQNLLGRTEAIARALQFVENAIELGLPSAECRRDVVAPLILRRECRGVRFDMIVAVESGELDRVEVSRAPR